MANPYTCPECAKPGRKPSETNPDGLCGKCIENVETVPDDGADIIEEAVAPEPVVNSKREPRGLIIYGVHKTTGLRVQQYDSITHAREAFEDAKRDRCLQVGPARPACDTIILVENSVELVP